MQKIIVGLCLVGLIGAFGGIALGDCETYDNSRIVYIGADYYCGGSGAGCTECWSEGGGCVTNGESCTPRLDIQH